jgi:polyisoprenyl-teichoic acid--peptidoglycan teichoic acid transferase
MGRAGDVVARQNAQAAGGSPAKYTEPRVVVGCRQRRHPDALTSARLLAVRRRPRARLRPILSSNPTSSRSSGRSAPVAALLSFVWPGLGQLYAGRTRTALIFAVPVAAVAVFLGFRLSAGLDVFAVELLTPGFALTILVLVAALAIWRTGAIIDAFRAAAGSRRRISRGPLSVLVVLLAVSMGAHTLVAYYAWSAYDAGSHIFAGDSGLTPGSSPDPSDDFAIATPIATPQTASSRINVLFTGIDSDTRRTTTLTDTLLVASIDPVTKSVSMFSFPRDIAQFPLWNGKTFTGKINSLMTYARLHPSEFPDGPLPTLMKELGFLLGVPIHYYAAIDLDGFPDLIDLVGGVDVVNPKVIDDPSYGWRDGGFGFYLKAGKVHLDGRTALAYVRSRKGTGDSDFTRASRQQQVLLALREKLTNASMLPKIPQILRSTSSLVKTSFPQDRVSEMLLLMKGLDTSATKQYVLGPPYATHPPTSSTGGTYILRLDLTKLATLSVEVFGSESRYSAQTPAASATP